MCFGVTSKRDDISHLTNWQLPSSNDMLATARDYILIYITMQISNPHFLLLLATLQENANQMITQRIMVTGNKRARTTLENCHEDVWISKVFA